MAIALSTVYGPCSIPRTRIELERLFEANFRKTLGTLVADLRGNETVPMDLKNKASAALAKRNWLVHHYFWERGVAILEPDGRASMAAELRELAAEFDAIDAQLTAMSLEWMHQHGVTEDVLKDAWDNLLQHGSEAR